MIHAQQHEGVPMTRRITLIIAAAPLAVVLLLIAACTPSAELVERSANERLAAELDLGPLECEETRAHPTLTDAWLLYCDRSTSDNDWALVDTAATYRDNHTRATTVSTSWSQQGSVVRSHRQTCEWAGSGFEWTATSCTPPVLVATFPLA